MVSAYSSIGRVPDLESGGCEFKSHYTDCGDSLVEKCPTVTREIMGSIPIHHSHYDLMGG